MNPTISRTGAFAPSATARPVPDAQTAYEARACQVIKAPELTDADRGVAQEVAAIFHDMARKAGNSERICHSAGESARLAFECGVKHGRATAP